MIHNIDYYRKIQGWNGTASTKEAEIRHIKSEVERDFENTLDCENVTINGTSSQLLITKTALATVKKVSAKPDATLSYGDTIGWLGAYWLVDELDADNRVHNKGKMRQCNLLLKWLNESGEVISRYCVFGDASKFSDGIAEHTQINTVDASLTIRIRTDAEVAKLKQKKRFLIGDTTFISDVLAVGSHPPAYTLTKAIPVVDTRTGAGYTDLIVVGTEYSVNEDNPYLMIANYYTPSDAYTCSITNATSPLLLQPESTFQLTFSATKNGTAVDQTDVSFISSNEAVATVSATGLVTAVDTGSCVITARYEKATTSISVDVDEAAQAAEIWIIKPDQTDTILYGTSKTYGVQIYENGVLSDAVYTATISGVEGIIVTVTENGVVVTVPDNEALVGREFTLTVNCAELAVSSTLNLTVRGWFF